MRRIYWSIALTAILALFVSPAFTAHAQRGTVVASAVVVPAQITRLSFLKSALVKEVVVKEGDDITAGQTLITLNTP
jgi:multidrug efflux pump subunit AcrA (membrane-fusion protein)